MELAEAIRRRRMVRSFDPRPIPDEILASILESATRAPSAGYAQGVELLVLSSEQARAEFWELSDPLRRKHGHTSGEPPVIVVPIANKPRYLERYSRADKQGLGMDEEPGWPVPYWDLDAAMAVMLMLLTAVEAGLGGWFFGIFRGEAELLGRWGVPDGCRPIGAVALGYPAPGERAGGSARSLPRRPVEELVHHNHWKN
jgi:nitroreductase